MTYNENHLLHVFPYTGDTAKSSPHSTIPTAGHPTSCALYVTLTCLEFLLHGVQVAAGSPNLHSNTAVGPHPLSLPWNADNHGPLGGSANRVVFPRPHTPCPTPSCPAADLLGLCFRGRYRLYKDILSGC